MVYQVNDIFLSNDGSITLKILRDVKVGVYSEYHCMLKSGDYCWNTYYSYWYIKDKYKKVSDDEII